jgi:uncharacterized membrane protein HdeD (DUF308 family)
MERVLIDIGVKRMARWLGVAGVASIVFGVILLLWPGISLVALTALFGAFAFVFGAFAFGAGLNLLAHKSTEWVPYIVGGLAGVLIGVITFLHPGITALTLAYLIAAWAFVVGVFEIVAAIEMWGALPGAVWLAIGGALSIVFGILVAWRPGAGLLAIVWLIGLYAILGGIARLIAAYRIHQVRRELKAAAGATRPTPA